MAKIISLVNQKGGVGKTTTSINLSASLAVLGKKVLLIDLDSQANATTGLGINKGNVEATIYEVLIGKINITDAIIKTSYRRFDMIPASINLAGISNEFIDKMRLDPDFDRNNQLKLSLDKIRNDYDYIIIDCPPSLSELITNALTASDSIIIPVQCEFYALDGITQLLNTILRAQKSLNPNLKIEGVLLTMMDSRVNLNYAVVEEIKKYFKEKVYDTIIPRMVKIAEAPSFGQPILAYDPKCRGTEAYLNLAKEVIERNGN